MYFDKYKRHYRQKLRNWGLIFIILGILLYFIFYKWQLMLTFCILGLLIFIFSNYKIKVVQSDIGKIVELTNADYDDKTILYSGKIVDIMYYKPYKSACILIDTRGFINSSISEDRGDFLVLFNRYYGDKLTGKRVVNVFVVPNNINITDDEECLQYSDFQVFCNLKYKK